MSIQSTVSHNAKSDLSIVKEISFSSVEKQVLQDNHLPSGQEMVTSPKFGTILSNLHELQSHPSTSKNTHGSQNQNSPLWDRPCKNSYSASDYPVVKQADGRISEDQSVDQRDVQHQADRDTEEEAMPISLDGLFIQDTLEGINHQQNLAFEVISESTSAKAISSSVDSLLRLNSALTQPLIHIEVQAAPIESTNLMTDPQQQAIVMAMEEEISLIVIPDLTSQQEAEEREKISTPPQTSAERGESEEDEFLDFDKKFSLAENKKDQQTISAALPKGVDVETATTLQQNTPTPAPMIQAINANNLTNQMSEAGVSQGQINLDASFSESLRQSSLDKINTLMQVKDHFQNMLKNQQTHLKINLIPQDLGGIEITIDFSKETVMATLIRAERRETMELLAKHAQDINQLFHEAGLQANLADMNFTSDQDLSQNLHENTSPYAVSLQMDIEDQQALQEDIDPDALVDIKA